MSDHQTLHELQEDSGTRQTCLNPQSLDPKQHDLELSQFVPLVVSVDVVNSSHDKSIDPKIENGVLSGSKLMTEAPRHRQRKSSIEASAMPQKMSTQQKVQPKQRRSLLDPFRKRFVVTLSMVVVCVIVSAVAILICGVQFISWYLDSFEKDIGRNKKHVRRVPAVRLKHMDVLSQLRLALKEFDEQTEKLYEKSLLRQLAQPKTLTMPESRTMHYRVEFPPSVPKMTFRTEDGRSNSSTELEESDVPFSDEAIAMCSRTLWHTIETTTIVLPNTETFVHTGDIDDLWLRDSAAQIHPLLLPFFKGNTRSLIQMDTKLNRIVAGLIQRHVMYIHHDPYANAFRIDDSYIFSAKQKLLGRHDLVSTWNYELDSACYTLRMMYYYYKNTIAANKHGDSHNNNNNNLFSFVLTRPSTLNAIEIIIDLWISEQNHENDAFLESPPILRETCKVNCFKPYRYQELPRNGKGWATNASTGMTWSGFRPSDDACDFGYLVPANMFVVAALQYAIEMLIDPAMWIMQHDQKQAMLNKAVKLQADVYRGIHDHGVVQDDEFGPIYAYEVDGFGNYTLMDDANIPSLLSIPYLFGTYNSPFFNRTIYDNTKRFIFSKHNPTFHQGKNAITGFVAGIGSPHTDQFSKDSVWPMAIAMEGLVNTNHNITERHHLLELLYQLTAGTGYMHESVVVTSPKRFTRHWFCWADSLYAELFLSVLASSSNSYDIDHHPVCPDDHRQKYNVLRWDDPNLVDGGIFYNRNT